MSRYSLDINAFASVLSDKSLEDVLFSGCAASQLLAQAHDIARAWSDNPLLGVEFDVVKTGSAFTALVARAGKYVIPGLVFGSDSGRSGI